MTERVARIRIDLDRNGPVPLYHQIARELERAIRDGRLQRGDYLENEVLLAEQCRVSRLTLRRSIQELVDSGILVRKRGVGTQVVNSAMPKPSRLGSMYDELASRGESPRTTVLAHEHLVADDDIAEQLDLPSGSTVVYIERCRRIAHRRVAILRDWVVAEAGEDITTEELAAEGLYSLFRSRGIMPHSATRRISARVARPVDAALLGVHIGSPLLVVESTMQDKAGRRIDVGHQLFAANDYTMELSVVEN